MTFLATLTAFLQAATAYFNLKNKTAYYDLLEKFDSRLDKLDKARQIARSKATQESQAEAESIVEEIKEEKKKQKLIIEQFQKYENPTTN